MKRIKNLALLLVLTEWSVLSWSCQDPITINSDRGASQLIVNGWINDTSNTQRIRLTMTTAYFDTVRQPNVSDAKVWVTTKRSGLVTRVDTLRYAGGGYYNVSNLRGQVGDSLYLDIRLGNGQEYAANTRMQRTMVIDSMPITFREGNNFNPSTYFVDLYAKDKVGVGDSYRFVKYKNGKQRETPTDILIFTDASADGLAVNRGLREQLNDDTVKINDVIRYEIHSLTFDAHNFLREARQQMTNGGIFSNPPANIRTNIKPRNPAAPYTAVGYFGASSIAKMEIKVTEDKVRK